MWIVWTLVVLVVTFLVVSLVWRWASRRQSLPCPTSFAWFLESPFIQRLNGTQTTLDRLRLEPNQRILGPAADSGGPADPAWR